MNFMSLSVNSSPIIKEGGCSWIEAIRRSSAMVVATQSYSRLPEGPYVINADIRNYHMRAFMSHRRTVCSCDLCKINCRFIPGYLLPDDLHEIASFLSYSDMFEFAKENLLASPGALVIKSGALCRIRTLVPVRNDRGWCKFFDGNLCAIHPVAPFGCTFFDSHQNQRRSNAISAKGLQIIAGIWEDQPRSLYCVIWNDLYRRGMRALAPEECRKKMAEHKMETAP